MTTDAGAAGTVRSKVNLRAQDPVVRDDSGNTAARAVNVGQRDVTGVLSAPLRASDPFAGVPVTPEQQRGAEGVTADDIYTGHELCMCGHEHLRHDMGHGCIECQCGRFVESIASLRGIFGPDWTGGLCSTCFVKTQRGYEPSELPHLECAAKARAS